MYPVNITQYLERTARDMPNRVAVRDGEKALTFAQLHERVLAFAYRIKSRLEGRVGSIIGVFLPKCMEAVIADLAILYSGNAYMNLDIKSPTQRLDAILQQTSPSLIIGQGEKPDIFTSDLWLEIEEEWEAMDDEKKKSLFEALEKRIDTDPLCLINTSGSTGIPKTVILNHRSFIDFTEVVTEEGLIGHKEIVGSLSPTVFDIFSFELCMLMAVGSTLVLIPETLAAFPAKMLGLMRETDVTFIFWVPTIMVNIANMKLLDAIGLPRLKMIWFAGEVFPTRQFNYWRSKLPNAVFANFYGPIEITLDCLYHVIKRPIKDEEAIPIGKPFRNTAILLLDDADKEIPASDLIHEGEICVRGSSLAMGYYNNPQKTAVAFVQNPLNSAYPEIIYRTGDVAKWNEYGELVFKGRKDTLIKHSGYRIELGEIEHAAINMRIGISNACALYDSTCQKIILVYEAAESIDARILCQKLLEILPKYMIPGIFKHIKEMPRNTNGKIDRNFLNQNITNIR